MISDVQNAASQESFVVIAPVVVGFYIALFTTGYHCRNYFAVVNATDNYDVSLCIQLSAQQSRTYNRPEEQRTNNQTKAI